MDSLRCRVVFFQRRVRPRFPVSAIATFRGNGLIGFVSNLPSPAAAEISVGFSSEATKSFRENGLSGFVLIPPIIFQTNIPTAPHPNASEIFRGKAPGGFVAKPPILSQRGLRSRLFWNAIAIFRKTAYLESMRIHIAYQQRSFQSRLTLGAIELFRENVLSGFVTDPRSLNSTKIPIGVFCNIWRNIPRGWLSGIILTPVSLILPNISNKKMITKFW